jgi:hypothetical protein
MRPPLCSQLAHTDMQSWSYLALPHTVDYKISPLSCSYIPGLRTSLRRPYVSALKLYLYFDAQSNMSSIAKGRRWTQDLATKKHARAGGKMAGAALLVEATIATSSPND